MGDAWRQKIRDYDKYAPAERRRRVLPVVERWHIAADGKESHAILIESSQELTRKCPEALPDHRGEDSEGCQEESAESVDAGVSDIGCVAPGTKVDISPYYIVGPVKFALLPPPPAREET